MARTKKAATKTTAKTASVSETPAKSVVTASEEKAVQAETPKTDDAKASVETKKAAETPAEKKADTKPAEEKTAAVKTEVSVQFAGKEYTTERLVEIAKDVWQYDLGNAPEEFKSVELYVKPEESAAYYVVNGEASDDFKVIL